MVTIPTSIALLFALLTLGVLAFFYRLSLRSYLPNAGRRARYITIGLLAWLGLSGVLAWNNVYNTGLGHLPPRIVALGVLPAILLIVMVFSTSKGRSFVMSLPLEGLTLLHVLRVPVELGLFWLATYKTIPEIMTFAGCNFDILAGLSAPFVAYYGVRKARLSTKAMLAWNFLGLCLLANIVIIAVLSVPTPLQQFGFNQPNLAVLNFPVQWLPTFLVPMVLFGHLAALLQLRRSA